MSSAILYLAIVAIWVGVLVPRWVHKPHRVRFEPENLGEPPDMTSSADGPAETEPAAEGWYETGAGHAAVLGRAVRHLTGSHSVAGRPGSAEEVPAHPDYPVLSRAHVLQARRRLLTMLTTLAIAAAICTVAGLTKWWTVVPPAGMLGAYLLLLHEAANADADRAEAREARAQAQARAADAQAARQRARAAWAAAQVPQPTAEVIDISARIGDQLYDQYADAAVRAVGD